MSSNACCSPLPAECLTGQQESHLSRWFEAVCLHPECITRLHQLREQARLAGFDLCVASGFRSYQRQAAIWNGKWDGSRPLSDGPRPDDELLRLHAILRWSALPGTSRHHWGSDCDLYARNLLPSGQPLRLEPWEYEPGGHQHPFYLWLHQHAAAAGFFWPYDVDRGGVAPEPWHLSYAPLAEPALAALSPALVEGALRRQPILGQALILDQLPHLLERYCQRVGHP